MSVTTPNLPAEDFTLDLSEGIVVAGLGRNVAVIEPRGLYDSLDTALLGRHRGVAGAAREGQGIIALFRAGRTNPSGEYLEIDRYELRRGHALYGKKLFEGIAYYPDGATEEWRIQIDPLNMRWTWGRQPDQLQDPLVLRLFVPDPDGRAALWQAGGGRTVPQQFDCPIALEDEKELLCVGPTAKNSFRLEVPLGGELSITRAATLTYSIEEAETWGAGNTPVVQVTWTLPPSALARLNATWGLAHAARDYQGRCPFLPVDATLDFDVFYSRMCLAALPFYIASGEARSYRPMASLQDDAGAAPLYDIALASEFLPLADPRAAGLLMRDTIDAHLEDVVTNIENAPREAALLLLLAGRYGEISGDPDFLGGRLSLIRTLAESLLRRRGERSAIPLCMTDDGPAKEPEFAALCFAGFKRLAAIEHNLAAPEQARKWLTAAESIRREALETTAEGGLCHPARGTFVRHLIPGPDPEGRPELVRSEFLLRQFVVPCALGLVDDHQIIQRAYDWIDDQYTYATGRGGASTPPGAKRGLHALLDVYVRQAHGIAGTDRVLQLVLDHALDFGFPMLGRPYAASRAPEANFADAAPYLGIVLGLHYGLEYTRQGWQLGTPRPLPNYPLTRVTGLTHKYANYSITWQGRGRIKRVVMDGRTHRATLLNDADGEHEVTVYLG